MVVSPGTRAQKRLVEASPTQAPGQRRRSPHASSMDVERERERCRAGAPRARPTHRKRTVPHAVRACRGAAGVVATAPIVKQTVRSCSIPLMRKSELHPVWSRYSAGDWKYMTLALFYETKLRQC